MLDHILGRPSTRLKRAQVIAVLIASLLALVYGDRDGPKRLRWLNRYARALTPWQLVIGTVTAVYAVRNLDHLLGFGAPEPLARMYSRSFYRTTWINTALDAGFATAMPIRPQWLKDILALLFSGYYLIYANEADEKLRKYRAFCTVEMMRETWHKTTNPYIRLATWIHRPSLKIAKEVLLPRPAIGRHADRPTVAWLFFDGDERALRTQTELILDIPGGGFISMDPRHHEERLRALAKQTGRPVLALNYCKAPEFPYPYALEECYDVYRTLYDTRGSVIGMGRALSNGVDDTSSTSLEKAFRIILSGDSAGGNLATGILMKIIEYPQPHIVAAYAAAAVSSSNAITTKSNKSVSSARTSRPSDEKPKVAHRPPPLPKPIAVLLAYPALNFAYSSWMKPEHIRVLRQQSEVNLETMRQQSESSVAAARAGRGAQRGAKAAPAQSPLNPTRSGRRPSLNTRVGLPSSLEEERKRQIRAANAGSSVSTGTDGSVTGSLKDAASVVRTPRDRALGLVPPPGVPPLVTSPSAILNSFMDKAQSVIRRSTSRGSIHAASPGSNKELNASSAPAVKSPTSSTSPKRPSAPKRDRSYSSLAGQAQMHLLDRARFAEAEPSASEDESGPGRTGTSAQGGTGSFGDEDENEDASAVDALAAAQRQYHQRVMAMTASSMRADAAADATADATNEEQDGTSSGYNTDHENRALEEQQRALRAATDAADARMASARAKRGQRAYGTRLTMTSMAGYFNDRILTQSMMRAMAILYIGPKYQPDFEHDYYLSPIVAPAALLAEFPPCLFICGEKDPICDDTVVMAGRIREAKTAKKRELERRRAGPSARFGEGLRMSSAKAASPPSRDPIEDESPEDWVQMRIIEGWSHGFLQMSALMPEAVEVIKFLGVWMWETFEDWNARNGVVGPASAAATAAAQVQVEMGQRVSELPTDSPAAVIASATHLGGATGSHHAAGSKKTATNAESTPDRRRPSEGDEDDDEPLSFTANKSRRSPVPPAQGSGGSPAVPGASSSFATPPSTTMSGSPATMRVVERSISPMTRVPLASVPIDSTTATTTASSSIAASSSAGVAPTTGTIVTSSPRTTASSHMAPTAMEKGTSSTITPSTSSPLTTSSASTAASPTLAPSPAPAPGTSLGLGLGLQAQRNDERDRRGSGAGSNASGGGGGGGGKGLDDKYRSMLVQESQLLSRRRGEAVFGLVDTGAVHDGSDEEGEGEYGDGDGDGEEEEGGGGGGENTSH